MQSKTQGTCHDPVTLPTVRRITKPTLVLALAAAGPQKERVSAKIMGDICAEELASLIKSAL